MTTGDSRPAPPPTAPRLAPVVLFATLLVSALPDAVCHVVGLSPTVWLLGAKLGLLATLVTAAAATRQLRPVLPYVLALLALVAGLEGLRQLHAAPAFQQLQRDGGWLPAMAVVQLAKLALSGLLVCVLFLAGLRRPGVFLVKGELGARGGSGGDRASSRPQGARWGRLSLLIGLGLAPITFAFFALSGLPPLDAFSRALPLLPAAILFAALNAFNEEVQFRACLLGPLGRVLSADASLWLTAAFFGLAHFFGGAPSGVVGVLVTGSLGALFAKAMLETRGIFASWFMHACQNAVIYVLWAAYAVAATGQ